MSVMKSNEFSCPSCSMGSVSFVSTTSSFLLFLIMLKEEKKQGSWKVLLGTAPETFFFSLAADQQVFYLMGKVVPGIGKKRWVVIFRCFQLLQVCFITSIWNINNFWGYGKTQTRKRIRERSIVNAKKNCFMMKSRIEPANGSTIV